MSAPIDLLPDAMRAVLGITSAKLHDNPTDAAMLINGYLEDAANVGVAAPDAWAVLFAASTSWFATLVQHHALSTRQVPTKVVQQMARNLQGAQP